ncbi:MAG: FxsA family protein [Pseudomonadota bacterium]
MPLFVLLIAVPIIEIGLFIEVGGWIGLWPTLAVVVATAIAGAALLRSQGRGVLAELQGKLQAGGDPTGPIAHGAMILFAGALLLTPGFFTDAVGFALLIPPVRAALLRWGAARFAGSIQVSTFAGMRQGGRPGPMGRGADVVDGEWTDLDQARGGAPRDPARDSAGDPEATLGKADPEAAEALPPRRPGGSGWTRP